MTIYKVGLSSWLCYKIVLRSIIPDGVNSLKFVN